MFKNDHSIFIGKEAYEKLHQLLVSYIDDGRQVFFLVDENTYKLCLPILINQCNLGGFNVIIIEVPSGEKYKSLETVTGIWEQLTIAGADRKSVLFNLGGGIICDMGGFAASCYNRGIETIHIPTTLLSMVDASVGGKTGIDFKAYKNHIGTFYQPKAIFIFPELLEGLPERQLKAALAEVIKYGFITDPEMLETMSSFISNPAFFEQLIEPCIKSKLEVTTDDPLEGGRRKILNFGHTIGHAIESFALSKKIDLLHGEAVAAGLLCELWLSVKFKDLDISILNNYFEFYTKYFDFLPFVKGNEDEALHRMAFDKKNSAGQLLFVLISEPGKPIWDVPLTEEQVMESLTYYNSLIL